MKNIILFIIVFLVLGIYNSNAQEKQNGFVLGVGLSRYIRDKQNDFSFNDGEPRFFVGPVAELMYQFSPKGKLKFLAGLSYQYGAMAATKEANQRFYIHELSLPLIFRKPLLPAGNCRIYASAGISPGKLVGFRLLNMLSDGWHEKDKHMLRHFKEDDDVFVDLYFDAGIEPGGFFKNKVSASLFCKYRVKENWMGYYKAPFFYGMKVAVRL